jgi:CDP-6-deoxy-D-xylo-4-hexulose-3-dehydrase
MQIFLEKKNIQTRVIFTGNILRQPGFKDIKTKSKKDEFPEADKVMKNGILIACHHGLTKKMKKHIYNSIHEFMKRYLKN